jgi:N-methylhydantoinase A
VRIAVDTGGTFTDVVIDDSGTISRFKVPSTPNDPASALLAATAAFRGYDLLHGTTVATNAILEGKTARTGLVVNEGFRDLLRIGRQTRPELYDWEPKPPHVPINDEDIIVARGRIGPDGNELEPLELPNASQLVGCEAMAICLLYAYANPRHEHEIAKLFPNAFVSLSHEVSPEMREFERMCATVLNAGVGPVIERYFSRIRKDSHADRVRIMSSLGGLIDLAEATRMPIRTVVSGPAGGVTAAVALGDRLGISDLIAFDMGGTSTDVTLVKDGIPAMTSIGEIAGLPVRLRRIDVQTIGCGGGSIAALDPAGALRVGPESAGAVPGPALYGGDKPTVTDANFVLGRLPLDGLTEQGVKVDAGNCTKVTAGLAENLGLPVHDAADAVVQMANNSMAAAVRKVSADRGLNPADFVLVAYGGAGAMHVCEVADRLEITRAMVPVGAGVFSAFGLLGAQDSWEESLGVLGVDVSWEAAFDQVESRARSKVLATSTIRRIASMRYRGQGHELEVEADDSRSSAEQAFHNLHRKTFGVAFDRAVEWVAARAFASGKPGKLPILSPDSARVSGETVRGRAVIADPDCTTFVAEGWSATCLSDGTLELQRD